MTYIFYCLHTKLMIHQCKGERRDVHTILLLCAFVNFNLHYHTYFGLTSLLVSCCDCLEPSLIIHTMFICLEFFMAESKYLVGEIGILD